MINSPLSLALGELRVHFAQPVVLACIVGIGVVLGMSGPFQTYSTMSPIVRLIYWLLVTASTYTIGLVAGHFIAGRLAHLSRSARLAPVALGITATVTPVLLTLNASFGIWPDSATEAAFQVATVFVVTSAVMIVGRLQSANLAKTRHAPALLDRLPLHKPGPLISLSVNDR